MQAAERSALVGAVQRNCDLADARYAREKSMCTYLLDMREHFRWAAALPLGAAPDRAQLREWIACREKNWDDLPADDSSFAALPLGDGLDPFDEAGVNAHLASEGWVYGAGLGLFGAPLFFLATRDSAQRRDGARVLITDHEWARGVAAPPAVSRGDTVIVRLDALRRWLWTRVEAGTRQGTAFAAALRAYSTTDRLPEAVEHMARGEAETLILHELGELRAGTVLGSEWEMMLAGAERRTELVLRAVRDLLADCLVTLPELLRREADRSLLFWFATFDGLRRQLAPELAAVFGDEPKRIDHPALAAAARAGADRWQVQAFELRQQWRDGGGAALGQATDRLSARQ